jgi:SAM-dependent methyltransferase
MHQQRLDYERQILADTSRSARNQMSEYSGTENLEIMVEAVNYNAFLVSLISNEARIGETVLDFGAGIGTFAKALALKGHKVQCIEPDQRQRERILQAGLIAYADIRNLRDQSVDLLYSLNVLEHIEDDVAVLRACYEKMKPGGRVLVYVPAFQVLYSSMDKLVGHCRRYTRGGLCEKMRLAGFEVVKNEYVDSAGFLASLLFKAFGSDSGIVNRRALIAYDRYAFPVSRLLDRVSNRLFGKNVLLLARRP